MCHRNAEQAQPVDTRRKSWSVEVAKRRSLFTKEKCHVPGRLCVVRQAPEALVPH